ncbi:hypothetical protein [Deinococcus kurensis]|uniref:hypothetical protein n=1 Tax=Deinococcus kurensis TaxID=2662757 RepID=UPI0012D36D7E|nr:hypothetical protein [Deinococcus kurensis]
MTDSKKTSGWFRHRRSGQVFEADGYQYQEACKNRDLEEIDAPDSETSTPSSRVVALRERLDTLKLTWDEGDSEETLNRRLDEHGAKLREDAKALGINALPNWRPETVAAKIQEAQAAKAKGS